MKKKLLFSALFLTLINIHVANADDGKSSYYRTIPRQQLEANLATAESQMRDAETMMKNANADMKSAKRAYDDAKRTEKQYKQRYKELKKQVNAERKVEQTCKINT